MQLRFATNRFRTLSTLLPAHRSRNNRIVILSTALFTWLYRLYMYILDYCKINLRSDYCIRCMFPVRQSTCTCSVLRLERSRAVKSLQWLNVSVFVCTNCFLIMMKFNSPCFYSIQISLLMLFVKCCLSNKIKVGKTYSYLSKYKIHLMYICMCIQMNVE